MSIFDRSLDPRDALYATTIGYAVGAELPFKDIERVTCNTWEKTPGGPFKQYAQTSFFRRPPGPRSILYTFAGSLLSAEILYKYLKSS